MNNKKDFCLQMMGITQWRLRDSIPQSPVYRFRLVGEGKDFGYLIAEAGADPQQHVKEQVLLAAIIKALRLEAKEVSEVPPLVSKLIVLGKKAATTWQGSAKFALNSFSLAELLINPHLKFKLWQDCQQLI